MHFHFLDKLLIRFTVKSAWNSSFESSLITIKTDHRGKNLYATYISKMNQNTDKSLAMFEKKKLYMIQIFKTFMYNLNGRKNAMHF